MTTAITQAKSCEPMKAADILTIGADTPVEIIEDLNAYFASFVNPQKDDGRFLCATCGGKFDGMMHALGAGVAHEWGLAHGEAACSGCGHPSRGMHYIKDRHGEELLTIRNVFLQYLPSDEVAA